MEAPGILPDEKDICEDFLTVFIKIVTKTVFENRYKAKLAFKKIHF